MGLGYACSTHPPFTSLWGSFFKIATLFFCGGQYGKRVLHCWTQILKETRRQTHRCKNKVLCTGISWHTYRAALGLNVFATVKSDKVTCVLRVTGSFSCVYMIVCFEVCLPCFLPQRAERWLSYDTSAQTLAHIWLFNASPPSLIACLLPTPLFSHLFPSL